MSGACVSANAEHGTSATRTCHAVHDVHGVSKLFPALRNLVTNWLGDSNIQLGPGNPLIQTFAPSTCEKEEKDTLFGELS